MYYGFTERKARMPTVRPVWFGKEKSLKREIFFLKMMMIERKSSEYPGDDDHKNDTC